MNAKQTHDPQMVRKSLGDGTKKKLVLLCSDEAHHRYLIATLCATFQVAAIVEEPAHEQRHRLFLLKRYKDYYYAMYHYLRRQLFGLNAYRQRYFALPDSRSTPLPTNCEFLRVQWINSPEVPELLRRHAPDITIVMGTSILNQSVLTAASDFILNIHGGYLPDYRGNHCFFFALYHEDFNKIGSTIHFINAGIDRGDIVEVVVPPLYANDTPETLYCRAEKLAISCLVSWIEHAEQGLPLPRRPQTGPSKLYRTRDRKPYHDILLFLRRRFGRLIIPERPQPQPPK